MTKQRRLPVDARKNIIIAAGARIAHRDGLVNVTFPVVANECDIPTSAPTVAYHFGTLPKLWRAVADFDPALEGQAVSLGV